MKKLMMVLAFVGLATTAMAQETTEVPTRRHHVVTNNFWANWYVQGGFLGTATYTSQEASEVKGNPFSTKRGDFGFSVAIGKWHTPGVGFRTKFDGCWAKDVVDNENHHAKKYWNLHEDVMFNFSNLIFGYNEKRIWNFIAYPGIGVMHNMSNHPANSHNYEISYNFGILNTFRVAKHWNVFLDVWGTAVEGSFLLTEENKTWESHHKSSSRHWDKFLNAEVGFTYNIGKCTWEKAPDVDALIAMNKEQLDALNAALQAEQDENARLRDLLANQKPAPAPVVETKIVKELASTSSSVFFNIGKSTIASRKDLVSVQEIADYAKANGCKLLVTGYADSKTGTAEFNQTLSEKRAQAVADELVKMGVDASNITTKGEGGVDVIAPYSYNRRATVKIQ